MCFQVGDRKELIYQYYKYIKCIYIFLSKGTNVYVRCVCVVCVRERVYIYIYYT